jgi:polygalacturonase
MKNSKILICLILFVFPSASRAQSGTYNILDFGAVPDSNILSTAALQAAIDPSYPLQSNRPDESNRPQLLLFNNCRNVFMKGLLFKDAPARFRAI